MDIKEIADTINEKAKKYKMATFRQIRKSLHSDLVRLPPRKIFTPTSIKDTYAFHHGARKELQFNIGFIKRDGKDKFRYGIGLSFEENQTLPDFRVLKKQFVRFTEHLKANKTRLSEYELYWHDDIRSDRKYILIDELDDSLFRKDNFIFFGKIDPINEIDYDKILTIFDKLLEIYIYVEGTDEIKESKTRSLWKKNIKTDIAKKKEKAIRKITARTTESELRHNKIQKKIYKILCEEFGKDNVFPEDLTDIGTLIDIVVKNSNLFYYEIKTAPLIRECIREAMGQLIEYAYWSNDKNPDKLIIVSENPITNDAKNYLKKLRDEKKLDVYYQQYKSGNNSLSDLY